MDVYSEASSVPSPSFKRDDVKSIVISEESELFKLPVYRGYGVLKKVIT